MVDYFQIITGTISELEVKDIDAGVFRANKFGVMPALGQLVILSVLAQTSYATKYKLVDFLY